MKRQFRPTVGALDSGNKGNTDSAAISNDATSTQPTRRARIKPKICISSPAARASGRKSNTGQPSTTPKTARSKINKDDNNQSLASNRSGISPPNPDGGDDINLVAVTANLQSEPLTGNLLTSNSQSKGVCGQPLTASISTSILTEDQDGKQTGFAGDNQVIVTETVHSKSPSDTNNGTLLVSENNIRQSSGGADKGTVTVDGQISTSQSTMDFSSTASTLHESSAINITSTSQVDKDISDRLSTGGDVSATNSDSQPSNASCRNVAGDKTTVNRNATTTGKITQTTSDATGKSAPPPKQVRRARIKPKIRIATSKTPVEKALPSKQNLLTPQSVVEKRTANVSNQPSGSGAKHPENTATINTGKETSNLCESRSGGKESEKSISSGTGNITSSQDSLDRSAVEASANPSSTSTITASRNESSCIQSTSKQTPSQATTRRARIKPRVGIVDRSSVQTAKARGTPSGKEKPSAVTNRVVVETDPGQQPATEQTRSVSDKTRRTQQQDASISGRDVGNELVESRIRNERGGNEPSGVEVTGTIHGNEGLVSNDKEKIPGQETITQEAGQVAEQNISLTCEELGDKEQHGVVMDDASSGTQHGVVMDDASSGAQQMSETLDPKDLSDSLHGNAILASIQGSSASPSCLPVMMEDSTIVLQQNATVGGLPSGLGANDTQELLYNLETADDLLQSLLNAGNVSSRHVPMRNSIVGITGNATTQDIQCDLNTSVITLLPRTRQEKSTTGQISTPSNQTEPFSNQTRIEPSSSLNETRSPVQTNETVTTSRLVTKRQRSRPKSRRQQLLQSQILDISSIPIASNIEIEQEISPGDGIDHPVLELPVDLQEDSAQSFPKASKSSDEWREKFQQRRSRTSKVVLSRKRPENSGVDKDVGSGTGGDTTSVSRDTTSSSGDASISSVKMSVSGNTNATAISQTADRSRSGSRKVYTEPNIRARRKTSKASNQKRSSDLNTGDSECQGLLTGDVHDGTGTMDEITTIVVDPENSAAVETENSLSHTNVQDLSTNDRVEIVLELTGSGQGLTNVICESANAMNRSNLNRDAEGKTINDCRSNNDSSTDTRRLQGNLNSGSHEIFPKASTPLHEVSSFGITFTSGKTFSQSQTDATGNLTDTDRLPPISFSSHIQDLSLNIPDSAIEEVILNTNDPLPDIVECPECPDLMLCLTTGDDTIVSERSQQQSQTQPGTLVRATRRTSAEFEQQDLLNDSGRGETQTTTSVVSEARGQNEAADENDCGESGDTGGELSQSKEETSKKTNEMVSGKQSKGKRGQTAKSRQKPKPNVQRKRKGRGKALDSDESLGTTGGNDGSGQQDTSVQDGSLGDSCAQDTSLDVTDVQSRTAQGNAESEVVLEGSTPDAPSDPVQDASKGKAGSRKRQGKAIKPKIPAKRGRKKADVQATAEARDESGLGSNTEAPESEEGSRPEGTKEGPQKKKRGRQKSSKKTSEVEKETDASSVPKTPKRRRKNQGSKSSGKQDVEVNISSMKICDMISYNPMTNPMTSDNENGNQAAFLGGIGSQGTAETVVPANENQPDENAGEAAERTDVCAPQVTIDADGNIVLDEESLFIASTPVADNLDKEVVVENANQQYNANHKRKNSERWGKEETLYFYEVLSQIGTDFSLMAKLFPKRNRTALKKKFKREERSNRDLIDKALSQRIPLVASLFEDCLEETEEEMERALVVQSSAETAAQA